MSSLGYQVADEKDCCDDVQAWFVRHEGKSFRIWGKTSVGSGCDYGTDPEDYPWGTEEPLCCFQDEGDECTFVTIHESYVVSVTKPACDRWGNTATYADGISLIDGCFELLYLDNNYLVCSDAVKELSAQISDLDGQDFVEWVLEAHPELVGKISETTICNGIRSDWNYITTNKSLNSPEWQQVLSEYLCKARLIT